jgi:hypothetical protein
VHLENTVKIGAPSYIYEASKCTGIYRTCHLFMDEQGPKTMRPWARIRCLWPLAPSLYMAISTMGHVQECTFFHLDNASTWTVIPMIKSVHSNSTPTRSNTAFSTGKITVNEQTHCLTVPTRDIQCQGRAVVFTAPGSAEVPDLTVYGWNDQMSSVLCN